MDCSIASECRQNEAESENIAKAGSFRFGYVAQNQAGRGTEYRAGHAGARQWLHVNRDDGARCPQGSTVKLYGRAARQGDPQRISHLCR